MNLVPSSSMPACAAPSPAERLGDRVRVVSSPSRKVPAVVQLSRFGSEGSVEESHITVLPTAYADFATQLSWIEQAYLEALDAAGVSPATVLLRRFYCSDLVNQREALSASALADPDSAENPCAVSRLRMPPMPPAKVALWAYHVSDPDAPPQKRRQNGTLVRKRGNLSHHWTTGLTGADRQGAHDQTRAALERYDTHLRSCGMNWSTEVIRTWLFVPNIQANYGGVVAARRDFFREHGLTESTHYITSTGIEGSGVDPSALITLDAYSVQGILPGQVRFLSAPNHLGPTHLYGVTFERGVCISYRDRRQVMLSGTASIDPQGRIVHPGDVSRQIDRALENVAALLADAGATLNDLQILIAYVRDPADQALVGRSVRARCGAVPLHVLFAPICRPGWLVEFEGVASVPAREPGLPEF